MIGKYCVVRTYSVGVHVGVVAAHSGTEVRLTEARCIWRLGASTLHEIALHGIGKESKISEMVAEILLVATEIIPTTQEAENNLRAAKWARA